MLETIRQYARDKLLESGEGMDYRNRHLEHFLNLAETAEPDIMGFNAVYWAKKLRAEYDNIRVALEWGLSEAIESALRIVGALPYFWITQGIAVEGRRWATEVLEKAGPGLAEEDRLEIEQLTTRAKATLSLSIIATDLGDNEVVCATASKSIALARKAGNTYILAHAMAYLASGKANSGEPEEAFALAQQALALGRETGNGFALGFSLTTMAEVSAMAKQDYEGALAYAKEAIALTKEGGYRWANSMTIFGLGFMARSMGDYDQARARFRACLPVFVEIGDQHRVNMIQSELAHIERELSHYDQAIPIYRETILEWKKLGHRAAIAHQLECFAFIAKAQEQVERALRLLGAAEALRERINIAMTPPERVDYEREIADLKAHVPANEFASLWAEGRSMSIEKAIEYALGNGHE
jgi:non-specific serine/threonine protein kinase